MILDLPDVAATLSLGRALARALPATPPYPALLLDGELGAGKTTLVRGLVEALPGGREAEVSSPSFNLMNLYPTSPPVAHLDLYRTLEAVGPASQVELDELLDGLDRSTLVLIVEWPGGLAEADAPEAVRLVWLAPAEPEDGPGGPGRPDGPDEAPQGARRVRLSAQGTSAANLLHRLDQGRQEA